MKKEDFIRDQISSMLGELGRNVTCFQRVRIADAPCFAFDNSGENVKVIEIHIFLLHSFNSELKQIGLGEAMLTVWRPTEDFQKAMAEGLRFRIYGTVSKERRDGLVQLSASGGSVRLEPLSLVEASHPLYVPRKALTIEDGLLSQITSW